MKTFKEFNLTEAKGLSTAEKQTIAKAIFKEMSEDDDVHEMTKMYLKNTPGLEKTSTSDHNDIMKMVEKMRK